jgi:hypothetical protein
VHLLDFQGHWPHVSIVVRLFADRDGLTGNALDRRQPGERLGKKQHIHDAIEPLVRDPDGVLIQKTNAKKSRQVYVRRQKLALTIAVESMEQREHSVGYPNTKVSICGQSTKSAAVA